MTRRKRAAAAVIGISAFSLGASIGVDDWWIFPIIVGNLLMLEIAWFELNKAEADQ
ncbi:hypothetical protein [Gordonia rubripertincta]|uniref:hypothetical protein n=1 Tax=Gordonia rubripertincta TaxID=36822 RepID=UPI0015FE6925|nr:hypothetical protein [Gordonia rubripertincta]QMU19022.1 hypothetical protein H3V45_12970 [Gordonia rubripertincta]